MNEKRRLFGPGRFYRGALAIAIPIMLQNLIESLVSLVDNFMVSGLGDVRMSGVNVAGQVLFVFMIYINTICMAGGIFMTQFYGAEDPEGMQQAFRFKLAMGFAAFIPYVFVCLVLPRQVLSWMLIGNTQASLILDEGVKYIRIMFLEGIPMTLSMCIASSLRDMGKVRVPLMVTAIATLTNALFNWLLIYGRLFMPFWIYMNAQQAVARAGGDTAMGAYTDASLTLLVMIPMVFLIAFKTDAGPVVMYFGVKLVDLVKLVIFHIWLKKERWLKNLARNGAEAEPAMGS